MVNEFGERSPGTGGREQARRWRREDSRLFIFLDRGFDPATGLVRLRYQLDGLVLEENFELPPVVVSARTRFAVEAALDLLHWVAGISYWKAACPARIEFAGTAPSKAQADWLSSLYRHGLAEFAFRNQLDPDRFAAFPGRSGETAAAGAVGLRRRSLVPMGGGKDSLVAWSRLQALADDARPVQVGSAALIMRLGQRLSDQHLVIPRRIDPMLGRLNAAGAWNGHVPVTAINAAVLVLAALVLDFDRVVFANERSADEATLFDQQGRAVNHQFSKSLVFERMLDEWVRRWIASDLKVFSLLRRDSELGICREFAGLVQWHGLFSSCNRNFHLDGSRTSRWCGRCPKCHFVFLGLAAFMTPADLEAIFGRDLLADADLVDDFAALLALDGRKPFECVGEAVEARVALAALSRQAAWADHSVVQQLAPRLAGLDLPSLDALCQPAGDHLLPSEWLDAA